MALETDLARAPVLIRTPDISPASRMRIGFAAAVTLDADISFGMAGLARLQVPTRLGAVIRVPGELLATRAERSVRLDPQVARGKP